MTPGRYRKDPLSRTRPGANHLNIDAMNHRFHGITLEPRITTTQCFSVVGHGASINFENDEPIVKLCKKLVDNVEGKRQLYGVALSSHPHITIEPEHCLVYIAGLVELEPSEDRIKIDIPAGKYAVFKHSGDVDRIIDTIHYVWGAWLPRSGVKKSTRPDFEVFCSSEFGQSQMNIDVWVSID